MRFLTRPRRVHALRGFFTGCANPYSRTGVTLGREASTLSSLAEASGETVEIVGALFAAATVCGQVLTKTA